MRHAENRFSRGRCCACVNPARGFTLVEALIASLIMASSVVAMISLWSFSFSLTVRADNVGMGYTVGRHAMERVKLAGFDYASEGATTLYYDSLGGSESSVQSTQHRMRVVTNVTSDAGYPSYTAARTVLITVSLLSTGETIYKTGATLTKKGI